MLELLAYDLPIPLSYRARKAKDANFFESLFVENKRLELGTVISPELLASILKQQFLAQAAAYTENFPNAFDYVIVSQGLPIGRFMLHTTQASLLLVDIAILPSAQQKGSGEQVMRMLIKYATRQKMTLELSVAKNNVIAFAFYVKLGFVVKSDGGSHLKMHYIVNSLLSR